MLEGIVCILYVFIYQTNLQTHEVSETQEHDHTNGLFYLWPVLNENEMFIHFYSGSRYDELIPLKHETSLYLDWHKDSFDNSLNFIIIKSSVVNLS